MNPFEKIFGENLHHAYLIVGDLDVTRDHLINFLPTVNVTIHGNPDFHHSKYDTLTKELAGDLVVSVSQKGFSGNLSADEAGGEKWQGAPLPHGVGRKIFIIETNIITEEAQNALLKVFEEPTEGTHFFILMPQDILLPTIRSRMQILNLPRLTLGTEILNKDINERLALVKEITDGISDEDKTKQDAITLLNQIESELYEKGVEKEFKKLKICEATRLALYDRGTPIKMVLENLMISI